MAQSISLASLAAGSTTSSTLCPPQNVSTATSVGMPPRYSTCATVPVAGLNSQKVLIIADRDLTAEEQTTMQNVGTLLIYNDSLTNINIAALNFDFFFVKLTDTSRQWPGINLGKTDARIVSISFSKNDPAQWHKDVCTEKIIKNLPIIAINIEQYFESLFSTTINKPSPRWMIYVLKIWGFLVQVFSAGQAIAPQAA